MWRKRPYPQRVSLLLEFSYDAGDRVHELLPDEKHVEFNQELVTIR